MLLEHQAGCHKCLFFSALGMVEKPRGLCNVETVTKQNFCPFEGLADVFTLEEGNHRKTLDTFLDGHLGWHRGDVVDCRGLYDPNGATNHPGIHVGVIEGVVYHRKFDEIVWDFLALDRMCAKALEHYPHLKDAQPASDDDDVQWPEHIIDTTQDEPGDTASEDRYDSEEDMETPAFGPSKKRRTRRERSQAASRSLGPRERGGGAPSRRGPPPLPPPSQPPSDSGSHATAAGRGSQRGSRKSDGDSSVAWPYVPDQSTAPKKKIQQSSSSAWEEVLPRSGKTSSDTPGSEAHIWRSRGSSRKTTGARPSSKVRSGSSRRTVLSMPARQSAAWAGIKDESDATWGAHRDASDSAGDARPKGPSGHRPGQGPRPIDLKPHAEAEDTGEKQPHEDEATFQFKVCGLQIR